MSMHHFITHDITIDISEKEDKNHELTHSATTNQKKYIKLFENSLFLLLCIIAIITYLIIKKQMMPPKRNPSKNLFLSNHSHEDK